jgi:hypothetical protein
MLQRTLLLLLSHNTSPGDVSQTTHLYLHFPYFIRDNGSYRRMDVRHFLITYAGQRKQQYFLSRMYPVTILYFISMYDLDK